jgi:DegV family protein with EDD domain
MTQKIALITDSTCDIPQGLREQYEIQVIPLTIVFGDQTYLDGVELSAKEFYARLGSDKIHPTTSQPSQQLFAEAYQNAQLKGAEQILSLIHI